MTRRLLPLVLLLALVAPLQRADAAGVVYEKHPDLDITLRVRARLAKAGIPVILTRSADRTTSLAARTNLANARRTDIFVSIHNNASPVRTANWSEVYHQLRGGASRTLALAIGARLKQRLATPNYVKTRRGDHGDYYWQLRQTRMPAVIVESAFVSNPRQAYLLARSPAWRQAIADAIADGILAYQKTLRRPVAVPTFDPGTRVESELLPSPTGGAITAINARTVRLAWRTPLLVDAGNLDARVGTDVVPVTGLRIFRDGRLIAELPPEARAFEDIYAAPGQTYRYQVRTVVNNNVSTVVAESKPLSMSVRTPPIVVCLDAGHGGSDPGAIGRF